MKIYIERSLQICFFDLAWKAISHVLKTMPPDLTRFSLRLYNSPSHHQSRMLQCWVITLRDPPIRDLETNIESVKIESSGVPSTGHMDLTLIQNGRKQVDLVSI